MTIDQIIGALGLLALLAVAVVLMWRNRAEDFDTGRDEGAGGGG